MELSKQIIDDLPHTDEKIIEKYQKQISKEISVDAKSIGIEKARQNANIKYGKFWRERLEMKSIYIGKNPFGKISYY